MQCGSGTYSTAGSSSCSPCSYGEYSQAGSSSCSICGTLTAAASSVSSLMIGNSSSMTMGGTTIDHYQRQLLAPPSAVTDATCLGEIRGAPNRIITGCTYCAVLSSCCTSPTSEPTIYGWCKNNWSENCPDGNRATCASYNCPGITEHSSFTLKEHSSFTLRWAA